VLCSYAGFAQNNNCVAVRGIAQGHLLDFGNPDWEGGRPGDAWVGPVQLVLGNQETLIGKISEYDGEPGPSNHTGQGRETGSFYFDFGPENGSFIVRYTHAVWPTLPKFGAAFTGTFHAEGTVDVTNGTGRFVKTTGKMTSDGPFLAWNLDQEPPSGRYNNTLTGTLCNVAPK
jgi:hypothetical protein